ncbi:uncharacterized protein LOC135497551 [Lineus longissimus]|uniref:uncharacterized protein LOC135497551 n=1 Tax=Lineus longissimus TaxID=88925 RepID=UPI002B4C410E
MNEISAILDTLMDENVLYTLSIVAVSSIATIGAVFAGYKVVFRKKEDRLLASPANDAGSTCPTMTTGKRLQGQGHEGGAVKHSKCDGVKKSAQKDEGENAVDDGFSEEDEPPALVSANQEPDRDPFEYCEHIQGEVKKIRQNLATKKIQEAMTQDQIDEERDAQRKQLEAIFSMMAEENDKFGIQSLDDIQTQMGLYV